MPAICSFRQRIHQLAVCLIFLCVVKNISNTRESKRTLKRFSLTCRFLRSFRPFILWNPHVNRPELHECMKSRTGDDASHGLAPQPEPTLDTILHNHLFGLNAKCLETCVSWLILLDSNRKAKTSTSTSCAGTTLDFLLAFSDNGRRWYRHTPAGTNTNTS